jgi:homoserine dehydrogenase
MNRPLRIGIAGLGTVGGGVVEILDRHRDLLAARCGRSLELVGVSARNRKRDRGLKLDNVAWYDNPVKLAADPKIDLVVEVIGGEDGIAKRIAETALKSGKSLVTANKALIAHQGTKLARLAEKQGVALRFEAAVAGGIPIIKALREGLVANRLTEVYGILNGTCNYILTQMEDTGRDFEDVLAEAQSLGYAEADPSFDIDGIDTAHKLAILASVAFGVEVNFAGVHIEGLRHISSEDIDYAAELGYRIKLLGITRRGAKGIEQRVHPCMVEIDSPLAYVEGAFNAIVAEGDAVEHAVFEGPGAGRGPTASAVVADIVDIARGNLSPAFSVPAKSLRKSVPYPMVERVGANYVRLRVVDEPGVIARVAAALRDAKVSIESIIQRGQAEGDLVSMVMITHEAREGNMIQALEKIGRLRAVVEPPTMIRIVTF